MTETVKPDTTQTPAERLVATAVLWHKDPQACGTSDLMMTVDAYVAATTATCALMLDDSPSPCAKCGATYDDIGGCKDGN